MTIRLRFATPWLILLTTLAALDAHASGPAQGGGAVPPPSVDAPARGKPLVLVGCVAPDPSVAGRFQLAETKTGLKYLLSGKPVALYTGKRIRVVGGLYPTANVAAQAGGIDPTKAANAATTPIPPSTGSPAEFTVTQLSAVRGACP